VFNLLKVKATGFGIEPAMSFQLLHLLYAIFKSPKGLSDFPGGKGAPFSEKKERVSAGSRTVSGITPKLL